MEYVHMPMSTDIDLCACITQHSADQLVAYKYVDREPLYLGYYFPPAYNPIQKHPAFIFIHGGAWESRMVFEDQSCWQGDYLGFLARYYANKGFVCISVDYRLVREHGQTPGYGLIDSYEDCCDAVEHILATANSFGIDAGKLYLLGESAGGHLAACVSTFQYRKQFSFAKVFLVNPITDLSDPTWCSYIPRSSQHTYLTEKSYEERIAFLSPLYQLDSQTSFTVLIHGGADSCVNLEQSIAFYRKMCSLSLPGDLHIIQETNHAFLLAEYTSELDACQTGISIINSYLF